MILVLGDLNVDVMAPLSAPIAIGEDCPSKSLSFHCGGVGANIAFALAALGTPARLVGCVGRDWFGDHVLSRLAGRGVDVAHVRRAGVMTGMMYIAVTPDGQRTIFGSRGANAEPALADDACIEGVDALEVVGYAFLNDETAASAEELVRKAKQRGLWTAIDVGSAPSLQVPDKIMSVVGLFDTVFANSGEALAITGASELETAISRLERKGCEVVLKQGQQGCQLRIDGELKTVPPFAVNPVDTTGAGDAFTAAFMSGRSWEWTIAECALFANAVGAAATMMMGAGEQMPGLTKVRAQLEAVQINSDWDAIRCDVISKSANDRARTQSKGV